MLRAILLALLLVPVAGASEAYVILHDWVDGSSIVGAPMGAPVLASSVPIVVDDCHREVLVDLLYSPVEIVAAAEGVGSITLPFTFRVDAVAPGGAVVASTVIDEPMYGRPLGRLLAGEYDVRVQLLQGAMVDWSLRVRGHEYNCLPPL